VVRNKDNAISEVIEMAREDYPDLPFHNFGHGITVWNIARQYGNTMKVGIEERFALETAALLHNVIVVHGRTDNKAMSVRYAAEHLPKLGYSPSQISRVGEIILATTMPQNPRDLPGMIICDADLDYLGRKDFMRRSEELREELGFEHGLEWAKKNLDFFEGHEYHTEVAREQRDEGKARHLDRIKEVVDMYWLR
jgi:uncharacterized protein